MIRGVGRSESSIQPCAPSDGDHQTCDDYEHAGDHGARRGRPPGPPPAARDDDQLPGVLRRGGRAQVDRHREPALRRAAQRETATGLLGRAAGDVQAQAGRAAAALAAAQDVGPGGQPGPGVGDQQPCAATRPRARAARRTRVPSGVCANTLPSRASTQRREVGRGRPPPAAGRRRASVAHVALGVLGQHRPERHPLARPPRPRRTRRCPVGRAGGRRRSPELTARSSASTPAPIRAASSGSPQRLGVQPQRGQRGAQPVRQVGDGLPLLAQQLADPPGQVVERAGDLADLERCRRVGRGRRGRRGPAGATPRPGRSSPGPGCGPAGRRRAGRAARSTSPSPASSSQARLTPAVSSASVTNVRTTAVRPAGSRTATRISRPPSTVRGGAAPAARRAPPRACAGAGAPSTRPVGQEDA